MTETRADDQDHVQSRLTCSYREEETGERCTGKRVNGFHNCLAHLEPDQLGQALQRLHAGADLDASGTPINAELLAQILRAVQGDDGRPAFGQVSFAHAHFTADADFKDVRFSGDAHFLGAQFSRDAIFEGAVFTQPARFTFSEFGGGAWFGGAQFREDAYFPFAKFSALAEFGGAVFSQDATFSIAQFSGEALFPDVMFESATSLGPLTAYSVAFDRAVFICPVVIEAAALSVTCRDATWHAGVTLRLRYAAVDLEGATFTASSFVTGSDQPFLTPPSRIGPFGLDSRSTFGREAGRMMLDDDQVRNRALAERGGSRALLVPSLRSLRGSDAANLCVTDTDLSLCRFAGARLLDQLRLEGRCTFDHPPRGLHSGLASPPAWWWSKRQSLAEERAWRAGTPKYAGWADERASQPTGAGPERLAGLYRQLRKANEDAKNAPGAADFYYGEMEMRRHARSTPWPERALLGMYWAISGYGLRATRALAALAVLILASASVLEVAGFPRHAAGYLDSLLYAAGSVLSLDLTIQHLPAVLTHWGDVVRILLRIAGPVFLGLAAFALRGRVKR